MLFSALTHDIGTINLFITKGTAKIAVPFIIKISYLLINASICGPSNKPICQMI